MRYVQKNRRIYDFSLCKLCGAAGFMTGTCAISTCMACETPQCQSNGGGNGRCSVCYVGLLPGWSGNAKACRYKGCDARAVAVDGKWPVCAEHLEKRRPGYVAAQLANRDKQWICIAA